MQILIDVSGQPRRSCNELSRLLLFPVLAERSSLYLLAFNEAGFLLPLLLPLSFGFAMLRSRLWEIDVLIYDTAKIVATFSATLRNEEDLDDLSRQLVAVVQETMQPTHVSLWLQQHGRQAQQQYGGLVVAERAPSRQLINPLSEPDLALTER